MNNDMPSHLYQLQVVLREKEAMLARQEESARGWCLLAELYQENEARELERKERELAEKQQALEEQAEEVAAKDYALTVQYSEATGNIWAMFALGVLAIMTFVVLVRNWAGYEPTHVTNETRKLRQYARSANQQRHEPCNRSCVARSLRKCARRKRKIKLPGMSRTPEEA